jgi:hypothetical protein
MWSHENIIANSPNTLRETSMKFEKKTTIDNDYQLFRADSTPYGEMKILKIGKKWLKHLITEFRRRLLIVVHHQFSFT